MKKEILLVNYEYPPIGGGAGKAMFHLAQELMRTEEYHLTMMFGADARLGAFPTIEGANHYPLFSSRDGMHRTGAACMVKFLVRAYSMLPAILKDRKIDLIHYFFSMPTGLLSFAHPKIPYIVSMRGGDCPGYNAGEMEVMHRIMRPLNRRVVKGACKVVAVSQALRDAVRSTLNAPACQVIPNGIDVPNESKTQYSKLIEPLRLVMVSRLSATKRTELLLAAVSRVRGCHLTLVGEGEKLADLKAQAQALGILDRVDFKGCLPKSLVYRELHKADVFVLPSPGEGMSNAMLEAMSVGLPVVGVNSGGTRELVDNGVSGWLADPRDLETGLTGVIARLVADRSGLPDAGRAARAACRDRFTWGATVEAYRKIYQECMFQSGTPRIKPGACGSKPGPDQAPLDANR